MSKRAILTLTVDYEDDPDNVTIDDILRTAVRMAAGNGGLSGDGAATVESWDVDVKIDHTPEEVPDDGKPRIVAHVQPQEWINDNAHPVGEGFEFDVTKMIEQMGREAAEKIQDGDYSSDDLYNIYCDQHPGVRHDGPFSVSVEASISEYFDKLDHPEEN